MGSNPAGCWHSLSLFAILRGTEPVSALTSALLYCSIFFLSNFVSGNLTQTGFWLLTWTWTSSLPLFCCTLELAPGPGLGHMKGTVAAVAHGQWSWLSYSLVAKVPEKSWSLFFLNFRKYWKSIGPCWGVFIPNSWDCIGALAEKKCIDSISAIYSGYCLESIRELLDAPWIKLWGLNSAWNGFWIAYALHSFSDLATARHIESNLQLADISEGAW